MAPTEAWTPERPAPEFGPRTKTVRRELRRLRACRQCGSKSLTSSRPFTTPPLSSARSALCGSEPQSRSDEHLRHVDRRPTARWWANSTSSTPIQRSGVKGSAARSSRPRSRHFANVTSLRRPSGHRATTMVHGGYTRRRVGDSTARQAMARSQHPRPALPNQALAGTRRARSGSSSPEKSPVGCASVRACHLRRTSRATQRGGVRRRCYRVLQLPRAYGHPRMRCTSMSPAIPFNWTASTFVANPASISSVPGSEYTSSVTTISCAFASPCTRAATLTVCPK